MEIATILARIAAMHLLAIASPGPTLVVVTCHAIAGQQRAEFPVTLDVLLATAT